MAESMWDAFGKGFEGGSAIGDKWTRSRVAKGSRKLEDQLESEDLNEFDFQQRLQDDMKDITRKAEARGLSVDEFLEGIKARRAATRKRTGGKLAYDDEFATPTAPLGDSPIAAPGAIGGGKGLAAEAGGIAPVEASPMGVPANPAGAPPQAASRYAKGWEGARQMGAEDAFAAGDLEKGAAQAELAGRARSGAEMVAGGRTASGEYNYAPTLGASQERMARRGDTAASQQMGDQQTTVMQKLSAQHFDMALQEMSKENPDPERVNALLNEALKANPKLGMDHAQYEPDDGKVYFARGDQWVHEMPVKTAKDMENVVNTFHRYNENAGQFTEELYSKQLADAAEEKSTNSARELRKEQFLTSNLGKLFAGDKPESAFIELMKGIGKKSEDDGGPSIGIKNLQLGPGVPTMFSVGGKPAVVEIVTADTVFPDNMPVDSRPPPGAMMVRNPDGSSTTFDALGVSKPVQDQMSQLLVQAATYDAGNKMANIDGILNIADYVFGGKTGGRSGRGALGRTTAGGGEGATRADRNNSQGNIIDIGQFEGTPGYKGKDADGFAMFDSPEAGRKANEKQLYLYYDGKSDAAGRKPLQTVREIITQWSPPDAVGNTPAIVDGYIKEVSEELGVGPDDHLAREDMPRLMEAQSAFEGFTGGSKGNQQSQPSPASRGSHAQDASKSQLASGENKPKPATKEEQDAAAVKAEEERRAAEVANPATHKAHAVKARTVNKLLSAAESDLREFDNTMREEMQNEKRGQQTDSGQPVLSRAEQEFRRGLESKVSGIRTAKANIDEAQEIDSDAFWAQRGDKKVKEEVAALRERFENPQTRYIKPGTATANK